MQITEIRPKPHHKGIYQIFVEGKFWAEVLDESIVKFNLCSGKDFSEDFLAEVFTLSRRPLALHLALNHLERWAKTKRQIKQYLFEKGFSLDDVDFVVWRLEDLHILNDRKFAEYYIAAHKTKGKRAIKYELKMKGVADDIINDCLEKMGDQKDVILHLAKKFART
ncbi:MAG: RecX family transcriptional regulator, partial [Clostridia bacterium]|nr:RecX family transcriptional regulator [Clostridia bacterium]